MGRLTLNMLLSFAQFEREVTGERIRDKITASKRKGLWMGGRTPLGYDAKDKKLVVNDEEAKTVRHIYARYLALGSVRALRDELDRDGIVSKVRIDRYGRPYGGKPLARGALYLMLQNRLYRGEIVHKDISYPGEHDAIIDADLWDKVQALLQTNRVHRESGVGNPSLLAGLLFDAAGEKMIPTHANKKGRRYRYYVSKSLLTNNRRTVPDGRRVPAGDLERLVDERLLAFLQDEAEKHHAIGPFVEEVDLRQQIVGQANELARCWSRLDPSEKRQVLRHLIHRIDLMRETLELSIRAEGVMAKWRPGQGPEITVKEHGEAKIFRLSMATRLKRVGMETRLLIDGGGVDRQAPDRSLMRLLGLAHRYHAMVVDSQGKTISELARQAGVGSSYFTRIWRLRFLDPTIVKAILRGQQPLELNGTRLANDSRLPIAWVDQRARFGIAR